MDLKKQGWICHPRHPVKEKVTSDIFRKLHIIYSFILFEYWWSLLNFLPVLTPEQVSSLEHVLPIQLTSWSSKDVNSQHLQVRLGTRVSSFDNMEMWVAKIWSESLSFKKLIFITIIWGELRKINLFLENWSIIPELLSHCIIDSHIPVPKCHVFISEQSLWI